MRKLDHQEIAKNRFSLEQLREKERFPIYALIDNIRSLYNVGSIFRSADGARIAKLFLCGYTPYPPRKEIEKTALGATMSVPWEYAKNPLDAVHQLKDNGIRICALEHTDASKPYTSIEPVHFPICLVVGNEINGIGKELLQSADCAIEIPMYGAKQSLNAAVAFGIAAFDLVRVYREHKGTNLP